MFLKVRGHNAYAYTANRKLDPALPSVVFIHGAGNDHSVWTLQSRYFAYHGMNAIAVDLPGHGRTKGNPIASITLMANWIVALLDAAGIAGAALVGHSMGSLIALNAGARFPKRVTKAVLIGTAVPMAVSEPLLEASLHREHEAFDMVNVWSHSLASQIGGNTVPGMWMTGGSLRLMEHTEPGTLYADLNACNTYEKGPDDAAALKCPALLILGARDHMTPPRRAKEIATKIAGAKAVLLPSAGHALMSEEPDRVLDELIAFL